MTELLDLYTRDGKPTGRIIERGTPLPEDLLHPVCDIWLQNSAGEVLIQRRSLLKPNWPGYWCCSAGGCVQHGESPWDAAQRETLEEIGLALDPECGQMLFVAPGRKALHQVWLFRQDAPLDTLTMQDTEVDELRYVSPAVLESMVRSGREFVNVTYLDRLLSYLYERRHTDAQDL